LIRLFSGEIDGALLPEEAMLKEAHAAGLGYRIAVVISPVREFDPVVAILKSRANVTPARRSDPKTSAHSSKGKLEVMTMGQDGSR